MKKLSIVALVCMFAATSAEAAAPRVLKGLRASLPPLAATRIAPVQTVMARLNGAKALPKLPTLPGLGGVPQVGAIVANRNIAGFGNGQLAGLSVASTNFTGNGGLAGVAVRSGAFSGNGRLVGIAAASGPASGYGSLLSVGVANTGQPLHIGVAGRNLIGH